jgi:hypothetical protein
MAVGRFAIAIVPAHSVLKPGGFLVLKRCLSRSLAFKSDGEIGKNFMQILIHKNLFLVWGSDRNLCIKLSVIL